VIRLGEGKNGGMCRSSVEKFAQVVVPFENQGEIFGFSPEHHLKYQS
jgi:hypothetical protein